jgi:hypothetical protein
MTASRTLIVIMCLLGSCAFAQQPAPRSATPKPATPTPTPAKPSAPSLKGKLIYKPVGLGAPAGRVDAGSRGDGDDVTSLYVLAPNDVGFATSARPTLFWFQTNPAELPFELSVLKPNDPNPILHIRKTGPTTAGFHRLDLAGHGVSLEPGVDYQWVVALVRDPQSRSRDIVSSGWIRHVAREGGKGPANLAAAGLWYDTITALFAQIEARPNDSQLAADRRDLFVQVGLPPLPSVPAPKRK